MGIVKSANHKPIRNVALIAHVDHGKTTLVDKMLRQAGVFRANQQVEERVMDSNPLERERGITILAKNTAVRWNDIKINIVDTPGHADFGGEVERILRMVQGVLLLVDAAEGPMPQTRFVTGKALELGLQPIVVINKVDRLDARISEVHEEVLELFLDLDANDAQLDAPFLFASAKQGWATLEPAKASGRLGSGIESGGSVNRTGNIVLLDSDSAGDLAPLFDTILSVIPSPPGNAAAPFQMLVSTIDYSSYVGRIVVGRIERGRIEKNQTVALLRNGRPGRVSESEAEMGRVMRLYGFDGLKRVEQQSAEAGDIVALAGLDHVEIGMTLTDCREMERLPGIRVEEPTLAVDFMLNDSPFAGRAGRYVTSRQVRDRLFQEVERNVALRVEETDKPEVLRVSGRGELHLGILMETMRREGYEFQVSRPQVITRLGPNGLEEPYEELVVDVPESMLGTVIEKMGGRRGDMIDMKNPGQGRVRMRFRVPARGLFGFRSEFLTDTRGEGTLHHRFLEYGPWVGPLGGRSKGVLVADREGEAVAYALFGLQERSTLFVGPGAPTYEGMMVGENSRSGDLDVNVSKEKKQTNIRAAASDENILLEPPVQITLEFALEFIEDDELIEITPDAIRLRKRVLQAGARKRAARHTTRPTKG